MSDQSHLLLLTEAAERTGLTVEALRQRIKRKKIRAILGNDRLLRVRLTDAELEALKTGRPTGQPAGQPTGQPVENESTISALHGEIATLRDRVARAEGEARTYREQLERAQAGEDVARAALADAQERWEARLDRQAAELGEERKARTAAEAEARRVQDALATEQGRRAGAEEEARRLKARGWLARLLDR
jgi:chromosome segregation ATPase